MQLTRTLTTCSSCWSLVTAAWERRPSCSAMPMTPSLQPLSVQWASTSKSRPSTGTTRGSNYRSGWDELLWNIHLWNMLINLRTEGRLMSICRWFTTTVSNKHKHVCQNINFHPATASTVSTLCRLRVLCLVELLCCSGKVAKKIIYNEKQNRGLLVGSYPRANVVFKNSLSGAWHYH